MELVIDDVTWRKQKKILRSLIEERQRQDEVWGRPPRNISLPTYFAVLSEEVGEVAKAIVDSEPLPDLRKELIQVAAVALAFVEELDNLTE